MKPAAYRQTRLFFRQDFGHLKGQDQRCISAKNEEEDDQPRRTDFSILHVRCENNQAGAVQREAVTFRQWATTGLIPSALRAMARSLYLVKGHGRHFEENQCVP